MTGVIGWVMQYGNSMQCTCCIGSGYCKPWLLLVCVTFHSTYKSVLMSQIGNRGILLYTGNGITSLHLLLTKVYITLPSTIYFPSHLKLHIDIGTLLKSCFN